MEKIRVREALIPWIASYLNERKHSTKVGSTIDRSKRKLMEVFLKGARLAPSSL